MATTYTLISSNTLGSSAASVTFSSIPATYTDLVLQISARSDTGTEDSMKITFNNDSSSLYSNTTLYKSTSTVASVWNAGTYLRNNFSASGTSATANTFGTAEIYIPSYTVSQSKPLSIFGASENNSTVQVMAITANLYRSNTAISTINITPIAGTNWLTNSSFYLYGIKNS